MTESGPLILICPDHISWVQNSRQMLVVDSVSHCSHQLVGLEAAVWSWLALGYAYRRLIILAAETAMLDTEQASHYLVKLLHEWQCLGLLVIEGPHND